MVKPKCRTSPSPISVRNTCVRHWGFECAGNRASSIAHQRHQHCQCMQCFRIDAIEQRISDARENPLLCFAFDKEPAYLRGVLEGPAVSMEHLDVALSADFLADLHEIRGEHHTFETITRFSSGFELALGNNMTDARRHEVLGFR